MLIRGKISEVLTSLGLSLVTDVGILLSHADHDADVTWATDDGREDGAGSVITGEAGLCFEEDRRRVQRHFMEQKARTKRR